MSIPQLYSWYLIGKTVGEVLQETEEKKWEKKRNRRQLVRCFQIDHVICMTPKIVHVHSVLRLLSYRASSPSVGPGVPVTAWGDLLARNVNSANGLKAKASFIELPEKVHAGPPPLTTPRPPSIPRLRIIAWPPSSPDPRSTPISSGKAPFGTPAREIEYCRLGRPSCRHPQNSSIMSPTPKNPSAALESGNQLAET